MDLYVIRHGRTKCNDEGKYNGSLDEDINQTGVAQALIARDEVKKLNIDLIICSPLLRAMHTCDLVNANQIPVLYDDRIAERECGELTNQPLGEFFNKEFWNYYSKYKVNGLETLPELFDRVKVFLDETLEKYNGKNLLLVTHGGVAKAIHYYFNEIPKDGMVQAFETANCEIVKYEIK